MGTAGAFPEFRKRIVAGIREAKAVTEAEGINVASDFIEHMLGMFDGVVKNEPEHQTSMQQDLAAGRPLELEELIGFLVRKGREHGVPTPTIETYYALLKPHVNGSSAA